MEVEVGAVGALVDDGVVEVDFTRVFLVAHGLICLICLIVGVSFFLEPFDGFLFLFVEGNVCHIDFVHALGRCGGLLEGGVDDDSPALESQLLGDLLPHGTGDRDIGGLGALDVNIGEPDNQPAPQRLQEFLVEVVEAAARHPQVIGSYHRHDECAFLALDDGDGLVGVGILQEV